jgi:hypothetical protein
MKRHAASFVIPLATMLSAVCDGTAQSVREHVLGPESAPMVELETFDVAYRIGDADGPAMLEQGQALMMAPVPDDGFLVYTMYFTGGPIQHFRDGRLVRTFGRTGGGPGEYGRVSGLAIDSASGDVWVLDGGGGRLVSFSRNGAAGEVVPALHAGAFARAPLVLPDGSVLLNGPGGRNDNMGYLLHRYDRSTRSWSSHYPALRDSTFNVALDRRWQRQLASTPDGKVVVVSTDYRIEILDPHRDFQVEARVRRTPESWPVDIASDYERRRREDPLSRPYSVSGAWVDSSNRLWVLAGMPDRNWQQNVGRDPKRPWQERSLNAAVDMGMDAVIEVIDLSSLRVLASYRLDPLVRFIVGPGMFAYYLGDLPHPRLEIIRISLDQEAES